MAPKKEVVSFSNFSYCGQLSEYFKFTDFLPFLASYPWVQIGSIKFKKNESVVIIPAGDRANFGLIVNILEHEGKFVFVCKVFRTKNFDKQYQAFRICERSDNFHIVVSPSQLLDFRTYSAHVPGFTTPFELKGDKFVVTKTDFMDMFKITE